MFEIQLNIHTTKYVTCIKANLTSFKQKMEGKKKLRSHLYENMNDQNDNIKRIV
jgi:hypothetical protein